MKNYFDYEKIILNSTKKIIFIIKFFINYLFTNILKNKDFYVVIYFYELENILIIKTYIENFINKKFTTYFNELKNIINEFNKKNSCNSVEKNKFTTYFDKLKNIINKFITYQP